MSYANVAASNIPPNQPQPDPALLTTPSDVSAAGPADDTAKVNVVPHDWRSNPTTVTSETKPPPDSAFEDKAGRGKASKRFREVEAEGAYLWNVAKHYLLRPGVAGGLVGLVNIGLLASATHSFYTQPHLRRDRQVIASTIAGALAILGIEGYAAEKYRQTPQGQAEERRAKQEGAILYQWLMRPGVLGGLLGLVNVGVLGAVGYLSYSNWDRPRWDKRIVSAISVGLLTLWGGEGVLAERYRNSKY
ncbi:hypothetical protein VNI00_012010 [Paramarasmius palmivorus]|uniref:Uncharacterized protein n=1 Tax=Paramarasmius palmivorus TaxID=297713 RepID=A0AAW0C8Q8_9AGAR